MSHTMSPGSIITAGDLLANIQLKDPSKVKKITPFKGRLELDAGAAAADEAAAGVEGALKTMNLVLDGYDYEVELLAQALVSKCKDAAEVRTTTSRHHLFVRVPTACLIRRATSHRRNRNRNSRHPIPPPSLSQHEPPNSWWRRPRAF